MEICPINTEGCITCLKRRHSLLDGLSPAELGFLEKKRYSVSYQAGETIYKEGTKPLGLLCLNEGKVKITKLGVNGVEQIIGLKKPVDFIGFRALMSEQTLESTAVGLETTSICIIDKHDFFKVVGSNKNLAFKIFRLFARELNEVESRMINLTQKHLRARLADALLLVENIYGTTKDGELNVILKRADLAALANMTPANAIRVLSAFAKEHIVEVSRRKILIKNNKLLHEISLLGR